MSDRPTPPEGTPPVDPTETFPLPPQAPSGTPPSAAPPGLVPPGDVPPNPYRQPPPPPPGYPSAPPGYPSAPPGYPQAQAYPPPPAYPAPSGPAAPGWPPPPAPPAPQPSRGGGRAVFIVLGLVVLLGIAAAIVGFVAWQSSDDELGDFADAPGDTYEIEPRRCTLDAAGNPVFSFRLTNTSGETRNFRVEVGFVVDDEAVGPEMSTTSGSLADGGSTDVDISGLESPGPDFTCRVTNVAFSGR